MDSCGTFELGCYLNSFTQWILDGIVTGLTALLSGFVALLDLLGVADLITPALSLGGQLPDSIIWGLILFEVPAGIGIQLGFLTARFVLRRIPVIG